MVEELILLRWVGGESTSSSHSSGRADDLGEDDALNDRVPREVEMRADSLLDRLPPHRNWRFYLGLPNRLGFLRGRRPLESRRGCIKLFWLRRYDLDRHDVMLIPVRQRIDE